MADENALRDDNQVTALLVASSSDPTSTLGVYGDPATHAIHVYVAGSATGGDDINIAQVNGQTVNVGTGAAGTGTMRVTTSTDSTIGTLTSITNALPAGTNLLGKVGIDQTTAGTTNAVSLAYIGVNAVAAGTGASSTGTIRVVTATDSTIGTLTGGGVASGATDSGNPVKVGGVYNTTAPTLTNGQRGDAQMDARANLATTLGTLVSGEDQTNNVLRVEGQFTGVTVSSDTQVKSSAGYLRSITFFCTDAAPTAGSIIIYDNTAESGTVICNLQVSTTFFNPFTLIFDRTCTTGIYAGFTTTADVSAQISYR